MKGLESGVFSLLAKVGGVNPPLKKQVWKRRASGCWLSKTWYKSGVNYGVEKLGENPKRKIK